MASLAIGYRVPAYKRTAGGNNAPETGRRYVGVAARDLCAISPIWRELEGKDKADVRVAFAKKEGAAGGDQKK